MAKSSNLRILLRLYHQRNDEKYATHFNKDKTVFSLNTSFSSVTNPNDLKISLSNRIREIKAICANFELDFESLSSGEDNGCSGLDMSIIESKVQDHTDSVAGSGSDKKLAAIAQDHVATSFSSHVPAASTQAQAVSTDDAVPTSCPIALNEFNEKAFELKILELVDMFPMEEGLFIRFEGHNPFCSASITVFEHSIRLYLMPLHSKQYARNLNRKSTGGHYAIQIMEQFNHLIKCLENDNYEEFVRFNIVDVQLSTENMFVPYKYQYDCRPGYSAHLHATLITNKDCISSTFNSSQFIQCKVAK